MPETDRDVTPPEDKKFEVAPENVGRTGYGEIRGNLTTMYGAPVSEVETFPPDLTPLERCNWYNYTLKDELPSPISPNVDANRRIWQQMDVERMLDHHPVHEIHPSDLPDYHYWPSIQNELNPRASEHSRVSKPYTEDATDIPRFFKTGVPKTPVQEQDWFVPLRPDGRFDYKNNNRLNGYTASFADKRGWDKRFLMLRNRPNFLSVLTPSGLRQFVQNPITFRHLELPVEQRVIRGVSASTLDRNFVFAFLYCGFLAGTAATTAQWKEFNWDFEIFNYDIAFQQTNRNQGGFHGVV